MTHWFYVGRDMLWIVLGVFPLFCMDEGMNRESDGAVATFGWIIQGLWIAAALQHWFK